ncbi:uncharacterized protein LOC113368172, partial [Ctenocephalides felis]
MIPRKSIDQVSPRQMRKRLMQAFNGCNNRESINLVENISTLTRDDGVRYDTILENDVYDYSQQNDQEDELEHKCVFEVEDESELDQPEEREVNFDEQVYENAPITVSNSMFLILMIFLRHNVSLECIADIIAVINLHCMKSRLVKNSLYKFRKYFSLDHSEFIKHYYCHFCGRVQLESDSICMNFTLETGGNVHVYPYTNNIEKRTLQNCRSFADNASRDAPIMGIKGPTALSLIMPDYVMGMAIDRMHCVEGGV